MAFLCRIWEEKNILFEHQVLFLQLSFGLVDMSALGEMRLVCARLVVVYMY